MNLVINIKLCQYNFCRLNSPVNVLVCFPYRMSSDLYNQISNIKNNKLQPKFMGAQKITATIR